MLAQQEYNEAVAQFQKAIAINPQFSLAYNSVGYALRPTGNTGAAEKAFLQYIALVPNDPNPYDSYAELLLSMGRFDESIVQYNKALSIDPHFSGSFVGIAANHLLAGRYPSAIAEAERYFNLARDDHERRAALLTLALVYVDSGATDEALRAMEREYNVARAIGDTASMSDDVMSIGHILLEAGRVEAARDRFQHARTLVSASSLSASSKADCELTTHYNLARVALATHDAATAKVEADAFTSGAATRRSGDRVRQAHELNGLLLLEAQHFDRSLAEFTLADQQNPSVLFAMAMAHDGKGERSRADELMTLAIHQYTLPTFPYVFTRAKAKILPGVRPATMRVTLP